MKIENLSMKKFLWLITGGLLATSFLVLLCLFLVTKNLRVVLYGGLEKDLRKEPCSSPSF